MKIAVTGCAGFIGSAYSKYILDNYPEDRVIGIDCLTYAASHSALKILSERKNFTFYYNNICDADSIEKIFSKERPDVVVNFAAESHVDRSLECSRPFIETNVLGTQVLLDASRRHGVNRFHQVSTDEVYGDIPLSSDHRFTEGSPLNPSSPYSASKAAADLLALSYMKTHALPVSISRSTNNYGINQHSEKLIPMAIGKILEGISVPLYGDGRNMRDWLYVEDHCTAIDLIIRAGKCEIYNVGAGNHISNYDLVKKIMSILDNPDGDIIFVEDRKGHDRKYAVSCDKLHALGWKPQAEFDRELAKVVEWYMNAK